jgi:integrase
MEDLIINKATVSVLFNREKKIEKGAKTAAITIRVYVPKEGTTHIDTGVKVDKVNFQDKFKHWVKNNYPNATSSNLKILNIYNKINKKVFDCDLKGEKFTLDMLRVNEKPLETVPKTVNKTVKTDNACFLTFFADEIQRNVRASSKRAYTTVLNAIKRHYEILPFSRIGYAFIKELDLKFQEENVSNNGRLNYFNIIKIFILEASYCKFIDSEVVNEIHRFKIKKGTTKRKELSRAEVLALENFDCGENSSLEFARDLFLFALYTGISHTDVLNLRNDEILHQENEVIIYKERQKTNELCFIPISLLFEGKAMKIVQKYQNVANTYCFPESMRTITKSNYWLRTLFEKANMKNYTMHCARHTFATYCLNNGLNKSVLQKMLGHSKSTTTDIYAKMNVGGMLEGVKNANLGVY